jgi:VIT1/CCC1 family predicted Fe2+/Mn2+ transporter
VPLLAYIWDYNSDEASGNLFGISIFLTSLAFIAIGWLKSYVAETSRIRSILETLFLGSAAAVLSYFVGSFLESLVS